MAANFSAPETLQRILDYLQTQTDLRLVADWRSLADLGLSPSAAASLTLEEQPLQSLLDAWLAPLKLDYRVVDARTVQISSQVSIAARFELQLYPVGALSQADKEKLIAELKTQIGTPFFTPEGGTASILYDAPSGCLLVSLPQPQQRAIAAWLRLNRKTNPD